MKKVHRYYSALILGTLLFGVLLIPIIEASILISGTGVICDQSNQTYSNVFHLYTTGGHYTSVTLSSSSCGGILAGVISNNLINFTTIAFGSPTGYTTSFALSVTGANVTINSVANDHIGFTETSVAATGGQLSLYYSGTTPGLVTYTTSSGTTLISIYKYNSPCGSICVYSSTSPNELIILGPGSTPATINVYYNAPAATCTSYTNLTTALGGSYLVLAVLGTVLAAGALLGAFTFITRRGSSDGGDGGQGLSMTFLVPVVAIIAIAVAIVLGFSISSQVGNIGAIASGC